MCALPPENRGSRVSADRTQGPQSSSADSVAGGLWPPTAASRACPREPGRGAIHPNEPIEHIHFPEHGIASVVANTSEGRRIEVGIYGRDGMSGTAVLLGAEQTPHENFIQVAGSVLRLGADQLRDR